MYKTVSFTVRNIKQIIAVIPALYESQRFYIYSSCFSDRSYNILLICVVSIDFYSL